MSNTTSIQEKKMDGAMRIFAALSGVDEELLANSEAERAVNLTAQRSNKIKYMTRFRHGGAVLVAAVCVLAVGIGVWRMNGPMFVTKENASGTNYVTVMDSKESYSGVAEEPAAGHESAAAMPEATIEEEKIADREPVETDNGIGTEINDLKEKLEQEKLVGQDIRIEITEAEARQMTVLGEYVPTVLPAGYSWEEGRTYAESEEEAIYLTWTRGLDSISLTISKAVAAEIQLSDVAATETYDVQLYEIPYAETVPKEYRKTFDNPVFAEKDFSLEIVEARMKSVADAGDTDTPRGNFAVLFEDGVLVYFNGRGTAQEIWEMFQSMN